MNPTVKSNKTAFWKQTFEGIGYGLFILLAPFEILFLGCFVWIPLLIWRERVCARSYGFFSLATMAKIVTALAIVTLGMGLIPKYEDVKVGPFGSTNISIGELVKARIVYSMYDPKNEDVRIILPSLNPTKGQIMEAIRNQTSFSSRMIRCASGSTLLFGAYVGPIKVSEPRKLAPVETSVLTH